LSNSSLRGQQLVLEKEDECRGQNHRHEREDFEGKRGKRRNTFQGASGGNEF